MKTPKPRTEPRLPKFNERLSLAELAELNEGLPEHLWSDARSLDFTMPPPPWDDDQKATMQANLDRLRVDPTSTIWAAATHPHFAAALLAYPDHGTKHAIAEDMAQLLSERKAEGIASFLADVAKMAANRDQPPHPHFFALLAYRDFMLEYAFNPTHRKLREFIDKHPEKYPIRGKWKTWEIFHGAGLVSLAGS